MLNPGLLIKREYKEKRQHLPKKQSQYFDVPGSVQHEDVAPQSE